MGAKLSRRKRESAPLPKQPSTPVDLSVTNRGENPPVDVLLTDATPETLEIECAEPNTSPDEDLNKNTGAVEATTTALSLMDDPVELRPDPEAITESLMGLTEDLPINKLCADPIQNVNLVPLTEAAGQIDTYESSEIDELLGCVNPDPTTLNSEPLAALDEEQEATTAELPEDQKNKSFLHD